VTAARPVSKTIFICADHGTAIIYFLKSDLVPSLLDSGLQVVLITDDEIKDEIARRFARPGLEFEGLRLKRATDYASRVQPRLQWLLAYLRRVGGSWRMNTAAMDSHVWEVWKENSWKFRLGVWFPGAMATLALRGSRALRKYLVRVQERFTPNPGLYADLFDKYRPALVIASTPGWRLDRYLLREAGQRHVKTMTAIVGWDNPSSYAIPGARVDWATCWSELQKGELVVGSDWDADRVHVGGMPSYDGYVRKSWLMPRSDYFRLHGLDPSRKLISYASSFVHFAPNFPNIEALVKLVAADALKYPAQLLIRLHPSHFQDKPRIFADERERVEQLQRMHPHVHVVQPVPLGGSLGYYGGEDMDEKASMMTHSDVVVTVYSTMLVESAIHDTPLIAAVLDTPGGWNTKGRYSLSLRDIGKWPTHQRFREAKAGRVVTSILELRDTLNMYLSEPDLDSRERQEFVRNEITHMDGSAGKRTADFVLHVLESGEGR
jgi:hypothetical protein